MTPLHLVLSGIMILAMVEGCVEPRSAVPDWLSGRSHAYPRDRYLLGVGEGPTRSIAEERAYAAVAKIFHAEVQAQTMDVESYALRDREGVETRTQSLVLERSIRVSTTKVLENVAVLDVWQRAEDRRYVVLAGLDRGQVERILLDRLAEQDRLIDQAVTEARSGETLLEQIRGYKRAIRMLVERTGVNTDLRVVRIDGRGVAPHHHAGQLRKELEALLARRFVVRLVMKEPFASELQRAALEGLTREGLLPSVTVTGDSSDEGRNARSEGSPSPHLVIAGRATVREVDLPDPLFRYVRWCAELRLTAPETRSLIGAVVRSGREGHITDREARDRAVRVMQASVIEGLVETLDRYFYEDPGRQRDAARVCTE